MVSNHGLPLSLILFDLLYGAGGVFYSYRLAIGTHHFVEHGDCHTNVQGELF